MALSSDPSVTFGVVGNALSSQSLAASASVSFTVDYSSNCLGGWLQCWDTGGGTVAATSGLQVQVFPIGDTTPDADTVAMWTFTIATAASTAGRESILLPTGKYSVKFTNLDATNGVTVQATSNPIA